MKMVVSSIVVMLLLGSAIIAQRPSDIWSYYPSDATYKITIQNSDRSVLSIFEIPKGVFLSVVGSRRDEPFHNNPQTWIGDVTIRTQTPESFQRLLSKNEPFTAEEMFQNAPRTMTMHEVTVLVERLEQ